MLPINLDYGSKIVNAGTIIEKTVVSANIHKEVLVKNNSVIRLLQNAEVDYDYYNQIDTDEGYFYTKKLDQRKDARYLFELNVMAEVAVQGVTLAHDAVALSYEVRTKDLACQIERDQINNSLYVEKTIDQSQFYLEPDDGLFCGRFMITTKRPVDTIVVLVYAGYLDMKITRSRILITDISLNEDYDESTLQS